MDRIRPILTLLLALGLAACAGDAYDEAGLETDVGETEVAETAPLGTEPVETAGVAEVGDFEAWDTAEPVGLNQEEFGAGFESVWNEWDANDDGIWEAEEATETFWADWDVNDNDLLEQDEWNTGIDTLGLENAGGWAEWNTDGDDALSREEFTAGLETYAMADWDADGDGVIGRDEVADTFWDVFDTNDDNLVDRGEWGEASELWS